MIAGKKLKKVETQVKSGDAHKFGKVQGEENIATSSKVQLPETSDKPKTLGEHLASKLGSLRPMLTGDDSELEMPGSNKDWDESLEKEEVIKETPSVKSIKKKKFLDSISVGDKTETTVVISPALKAIKENFPHLSKKTLEKLSTPEGMRDRVNIIDSLPEEELVRDVKPKLELKDVDKNKVDKILNETMNLDSEAVV